MKIIWRIIDIPFKVVLFPVILPMAWLKNKTWEGVKNDVRLFVVNPLF